MRDTKNVTRVTKDVTRVTMFLSERGYFPPFISSVDNVHGILTENPTWFKNCSILSYGKKTFACEK